MDPRNTDAGGAESRLTRRDLLRQGAFVGAVLAVPGIAAACGGGGSSDGGEATPTTAAADTGAAATTEAATTEAAETTAAGPTPGGTFRMAQDDGGTSETLDPQAFVSQTDQFRTLNIWDRLAEVQEDNTVKLWLAESIEAKTADDATAWVVRLKPDIVFHNGKALSADDVVWTFQRLLREDAPYFSAVDPFIDGNALTKVDDLTVEFGLKQPYGDFPRYLTNRFLHIIPDGADTFTSPAECIGTGPFTLAEWTAGERAVMQKNPNWWNPGQPYLDAVEILQIDKASQLNALLASQIDGTATFESLAQAAPLEGNAAVQLFSLPGANVPNMTMRLDAKPFDDPNVRLAFKYAFDRQTMLDTLYLGRGSLGNDLHGKPFPSYNSELPQREYDPEQAKSLLKQAGYDTLDVELVTGLYTDQAQVYAEQAKAAGINVKLKKVPGEDIYNTDLYYLKTPFSETSWGAESFESIVPQGYVEGAPFNETAWQRPDWDKRFFEATGTVDEAQRNAIYYELQQELYDEGGYLIGAYGDSLYGGSPVVKGVVEQVPGFIWNDARLELVWLEQ